MNQHKSCFAMLASFLIWIVSLQVFEQQSPCAETVAPPSDRQDKQEPETWTKKVTDRSKRDSLSGSAENVRGDSGKWNDKPKFQYAPPLGQKPPRMLLDDWAESLDNKKIRLTGKDDTWFILQTRQLNDNDRVWVEKVERRGDQLEITVHEAVWTGRYSKNFTYYKAMAVNIGKLKAGKYTATLRIKNFEFQKFDGSGRPKDSWSLDEKPVQRDPVELKTEFMIQ